MNFLILFLLFFFFSSVAAQRNVRVMVLITLG